MGAAAPRADGRAKRAAGWQSAWRTRASGMGGLTLLRPADAHAAGPRPPVAHGARLRPWVRAPRRAAARACTQQGAEDKRAGSSGDAGVYGLYSVIKRSPVGGMGDEKKLEFLETAVGKWVNSVTQWELDALGEYKVRKCQERAPSKDIAEARQDINATVASNAVVLYSFTACPWCVKAKKLLDDAEVQYVTIEVDEQGAPRGPALQAALGTLTGRTSMPNLFIGGKSIGGCEDGTPGLVALVEGAEGGLRASVDRATAATGLAGRE